MVMNDPPRARNPPIGALECYPGAVLGMLHGQWSNELTRDEIPKDFGDRMVTHRVPSPQFEAESNRYHLYASFGCPWAHLTMLARTLLGLEQAVGLVITDPWIDPKYGWWFQAPDPIEGKKYLHELYSSSEPQFTGRVTVPVLWDARSHRIVQNYSTGILRIFEFGLRDLHMKDQQLLHQDQQEEIHKENVGVLENVTYRIYDVGCAQSQAEYDRNISVLFESLDQYDERLRTQNYLLGETLTESDLRLFVSLIRFDCAYYGALLCNVKKISDYPGLQAYLERIYALPGVAQTVCFDEIRTHYFDDDGYVNHKKMSNGRYIVPRGPRNPLEPDCQETKKPA